MHSILISTKEGKPAARGGSVKLQTYRVRHRIDGLTQVQAEEIEMAVTGRMTGPNRIDSVDAESDEILADAQIGSEWSTPIF